MNNIVKVLRKSTTEFKKTFVYRFSVTVIIKANTTTDSGLFQFIYLQFIFMLAIHINMICFRLVKMRRGDLFFNFWFYINHLTWKKYYFHKGFSIFQFFSLNGFRHT